MADSTDNANTIRPQAPYELVVNIDARTTDEAAARLEDFAKDIRNGAVTIHTGMGRAIVKHNKGQTPENYDKQLEAWCQRRREARVEAKNAESEKVESA